MNSTETITEADIVTINADGSATVFLHEPEHIIRLALLAHDLTQRLEEAKTKIKELEDKLVGTVI